MTTTEHVQRGNCATTAIAVAAQIPGAKIVHGYPLGRSGEAAGLRYWHAWVETTSEGRTLCVDFSNGLEVVMARSRYYRLGQIRDVLRYSASEALAMVERYGHAGPWDGTEPPAQDHQPEGEQT